MNTGEEDGINLQCSNRPACHELHLSNKQANRKRYENFLNSVDINEIMYIIYIYSNIYYINVLGHTL